MIQVVLFLCCVLLSPGAAFPRNAQNEALNVQPSVTETGPLPNVLSNQISLSGPTNCQDLLHRILSFAPLPDYLSNLVLMVALEEADCPTVLEALQLQLTKMGGKDTTEILSGENQRPKEEKGIGNTKITLMDLGRSLGELRRVQRSATIPEACSYQYGWVVHDTAKLIVEFAEKLPSSELTTEFKNAAINVTQLCTEDSWDHLTTIGHQLIASPHIRDHNLSTQDKTYFIQNIIAILLRLLIQVLKKVFDTYFG